MKPRAAIILIHDERIALIERWRSGRHYFVFPGGKIKRDESPSVAATREAREELGLDVQVEEMLAEVWYLGTPQYYFLAAATTWQFGPPTGKEMSNLPGSIKGSYLPVWLSMNEITHQPVLPKVVAEFVAKSHPNRWPATPLMVTNQPPDEVN
jgi:8-oxo-dGTP diphosphatase